MRAVRVRGAQWAAGERSGDAQRRVAKGSAQSRALRPAPNDHRLISLTIWFPRMRVTVRVLAAAVLVVPGRIRESDSEAGAPQEALRSIFRKKSIFCGTPRRLGGRQLRSGRSNRFHRLRRKNLHGSIKKIIKKY